LPVLELETKVKASPELVWQVVSDLGAFSKVASNIERVDIIRKPGANLIRRLYDKDGHGWDEERIAHVAGQSMTMRVDAHYYSAAFSSMTYTWSVFAFDDESVCINMHYTYSLRWGILGTLLDPLRFRPKLKQVCQEILDNWVKLIHSQEWAWRVLVDQVLHDKGRDVVTVNSGANLNVVIAKLDQHGIGCVPVLNADAQLAGMISERDVVKAVAEHGPEGLQKLVDDVMSTDVLTASPTDSMAMIMRRMNDQRVRHLPVLDGGGLVGLISIGDVVNARIAELEGESVQLRDFIETRRFNELYKKIGPAAYGLGQVVQDDSS